jgi:hypothetical protein
MAAETMVGVSVLTNRLHLRVAWLCAAVTQGRPFIMCGSAQNPMSDYATRELRGPP